MGLGDELMVSGAAAALRTADSRPVVVLGKDGRPRWHPLWDGNADLIAPQTMVDHPGGRPYVDYAAIRELAVAKGAPPDCDAKTALRIAGRWIWKRDFRPLPGRIAFTAEELTFGDCGAGAVVVEPNLKAGASPNKGWLWARWRALVAGWPALDWLQLGPAGTRRLPGARFVETAPGPAGFRHTCAALARARAAVLPEGGLHHAAAAVGLRAVVIFGAWSDPRVLGYDSHINLYRPHEADGGPCGLIAPCADCEAAKAAICVEDVLSALERLLRL